MKKLGISVIALLSALLTALTFAGCETQKTVEAGKYVLDGDDVAYVEIVNFRMLKLSGFETYLGAIQEAWLSDPALNFSAAQKEKVDLVKGFSSTYETNADGTRVFTAKFETDKDCTRVYVAAAAALVDKDKPGDAKLQLCVTFEYSDADKTITLRLSEIGGENLVFKLEAK